MLDDELNKIFHELDTYEVDEETFSFQIITKFIHFPFVLWFVICYQLNIVSKEDTTRRFISLIYQIEVSMYQNQN